MPLIKEKEMSTQLEIIEEVIQDVINTEREEFKAKVKEWILNGIRSKLESPYSSPLAGVINEAMQRAVTEDLKKEITESVSACITEIRPEIIEATKKTLRTNAIALNDAISLEFLNKMADEWQRRKIFEQIFNKKDT